MIFVLSYLLGSIPFSLIIAKIKGIDLREMGSGNIGVANVARTIRDRKLVILALFLDSFKGFIAVCLVQQLFYSICHYFISAVLAIIGHMFPIWLKFNGGKGVATTLGVLMALNIDMTLIFIFVWLLIFFIFRYFSLASLTAIFITVIVSLFFQKDLFLFLLIVAVLLFLKHHRNIVNLFYGKECKFLSWN